MKKIFNSILFLGLSLVGCASYGATNASFSITATIGTIPITVETSNGLNFGTIPAQSSTPINISPNSGSAASFIVKGSPGTAFTAFVSATGGETADTSVDLAKQSSGTGVSTLTVNGFSFSGLDTSSATGGTGTINTSGQNTINFGATANPSGGEAPGGSYTGTMFLVIAEQ